MLVTSALILSALTIRSNKHQNLNKQGNITMFESDTLDDANKTAKFASLAAIGFGVAHLYGPLANAVQGVLGRHVGDGEEDFDPDSEV
jgi:hypothetical protein